jgi:heme/copper-type cytochrome/quinol oxidase subunit 2
VKILRIKNWIRGGAVCAGLIALLPGKASACAACYGAHIDDAMADGMNWAILTLGVIVATVLGTFLTFLIYVIRRSEALEAAKNPAPAPAAAART